MILTATSADPGDPGHLLPDDAWARVVQGAQARRVLPATPGLMGVPDRTIRARSHGGTMAGGPRLGVIHSAETPLRAGYAYSIAANWFATLATTSATVMIDPAETIRLLPDDVVSYAVGPQANGFTVNVEQAGYARLSRQEWTVPEGLAQLDRVATYMQECRDRWGLPLHWATDAEIRRAKTDPTFRAGWCTHDDIRRVLGGTSHTDPMPHYPADLLMAAALGEDDEMASTEALQLLREIRAQLTGSGNAGEYPGLADLAGANGKPRTVVHALAALNATPTHVTELRYQLTGSGKVGEYPGLADLADGAGRPRTVVQALAAVLASGGDRALLLELVREAVREAQGDDNDALADSIVDRLGHRLAGA